MFFPHLGFRSGNIFLTAPFPDLCLFNILQVSDVLKSVVKDKKFTVHNSHPVAV